MINLAEMIQDYTRREVLTRIEYKLIDPVKKCISDQIGSDIQHLVYSRIRGRSVSSVIYRVRTTIWGQVNGYLG